MKWLFCLAKGPVVGEDADIVVKVKETKLANPQKAVLQPKLEKQDSAFVERKELREATPPEDSIEAYSNPVSVELSQTESAQGKPAALQLYGPPKAICNEARLANLEELGVMKKPPGDPQIRALPPNKKRVHPVVRALANLSASGGQDAERFTELYEEDRYVLALKQHIMQLMCTVFNTESALVAFVGDDSVFIHDSINFKKGDFAWRMSFCAHTLTPANHQVMVIEDASNDARFAHLPLVRQKKVQFYAGTPIVSSKGHRLGTVCFASSQPRKFDAEGCNMLSNMGELVIRELEREWANQLQAKALTSKGQEPQLLRAMECFNEAVMFVDVSTSKWDILHLNAAAQTKLKLFDVVVDIKEGKQTNFWELFQLTSQSSNNSTAPWEAYAADIKAGHKFTITSARFSSGLVHKSAQAPAFSMTFRSAANDVIDSSSVLVGAPAHMPMTESNRQYYFVTLSQNHGSHSSTSSIRSLTSGAIDPEMVPFDDIELGPLLGKGGYGRVYRGVRGNQTLAIKVIDNTSSLRMMDGQPLEAAITKDAHHPNILQTLDYAVTSTARSDSDSESGEERFDSAHSRHRRQGHDSETWMVLEYCDCGCLQHLDQTSAGSQSVQKC